MLSGKELGAALAEAIALKTKHDQKRVTQQAIADAFGVKQSSVAGWLVDGRIDKKHIPKLLDYFKDVAGPAHWGLPFSDQEFELILSFREMHADTRKQLIETVNDMAGLEKDARQQAANRLFRNGSYSMKTTLRVAEPGAPDYALKLDADSRVHGLTDIKPARVSRKVSSTSHEFAEVASRVAAGAPKNPGPQHKKSQK